MYSHYTCNTLYFTSLRHYTVFILVSLTYLPRRCTLMTTVYMLTYSDLYTAGHSYMFMSRTTDDIYGWLCCTPSPNCQYGSTSVSFPWAAMAVIHAATRILKKYTKNIHEDN